MNIDFLCSDGSQLGVTSKTIWGDRQQIGVGGAELALLTMCEEFTKHGHTVRLFNNPRERNDLFEQAPLRSFPITDPHRDVLVVFRSPNPKGIPANGYKVWWSCDQFTNGNFAAYAKYMKRIVTISEFHRHYFNDNYAIDNTVVTDLPVRVDDYDLSKQENIKHRFLFSSVPDRGLEELWRLWPLIRKEIPDAHLIITSDYRLWGTIDPRNDRFRVRWMARDGFEFLGGVNRTQLIEEQLKASVMIYPCVYDELFCISVAEAQYAGVYPITTNKGALETTNMGTVVNWNAMDKRGDGLFVETIVNTINHPDFEKRVKLLQSKAKTRFHPDTIVKYWQENILNGT